MKKILEMKLIIGINTIIKMISEIMPILIYFRKRSHIEKKIMEEGFDADKTEGYFTLKIKSNIFFERLNPFFSK